MPANPARFRVVNADTPELLKQVYSIRRKVFIEEQKIPDQFEFDNFEKSARHFLVRDNSGNAAGACRWRMNETSAKLERFCVLPAFRRQGAASALISALLDDIRLISPATKMIYLNAQLEAEALYLSNGFVRCGDVFMECDIPHVRMEYKPPAQP